MAYCANCNADGDSRLPSERGAKRADCEGAGGLLQTRERVFELLRGGGADCEAAERNGFMVSFGNGCPGYYK